MNMTEQRQRADGTWTYATAEHDAKWYWPVGTSVLVRMRGTGRSIVECPGVIIKENTVTVRVRLTDGREVMAPVGALRRVE
jgi:hypothetical protein